MDQYHNKFKVFIPEAGLPYAEAMKQLSGQVADFTKDRKVAPKSVGIEYLESAQRLVLSLGYRDDETGYPVALASISLGKLTLAPEAIEQKMSAAAETVKNVLCHEFFVTGDGEFVMVLLSHE